MKISHIFYIIITVSLFFGSCKQNNIPKPTGYMRIDFPDKKYQKFDTTFPYCFDYAKYAIIKTDNDLNTEPYWINIDYPQFKGRIHITYKPLQNNVFKYIEDAHTFVYKHTIKADAIEEHYYKNDSTNVYGTLYDIKGNAASSIQFFLTDSTEHFLRGALYFYTKPNKDSLAPVIKFVRQDIVRIIESFEWK